VRRETNELAEAQQISDSTTRLVFQFFAERVE
jgi:hypothetical protein